MTKKKVMGIFLLILALLVTGVFFYYTTPLSAQTVFPHFDQIDKIDIWLRINRMEEDATRPIGLTIDDPNEVNELKRIFKSTTYQRRVRPSINILNYGDVGFMGVIFYGGGNSGNYDIDLNSEGTIYVNKKTYKIRDKEAFTRFYEFIERNRSRWTISK